MRLFRMVEDLLGVVGIFGVLGQREIASAGCLATVIGVLHGYNFECTSTWAF